MPMILATGGGAYLAGRARACAPSPRSTCARRECLDPHYFAVLIGVGATTVNAYLAEETHRRPASRAACSASLTLDECLARYKQAVDEGLLKIISKMGISVISSYRGG